MALVHEADAVEKFSAEAGNRALDIGVSPRRSRRRDGLLDTEAFEPPVTPDRSMLRLLAQANRYREMMLEAQGRTMLDLAREAGVGRPYFCRIVRLGFLAPDVVKAVYRCSGNVLLWMRYT